MEHVSGTIHILKMDDEEFDLTKQSLEFFHECTVKSQEFKNDEESTVNTAIKLEQMGRTLGITL